MAVWCTGKTAIYRWRFSIAFSRLFWLLFWRESARKYSPFSWPMSHARGNCLLNCFFFFVVTPFFLNGTLELIIGNIFSIVDVLGWVVLIDWQLKRWCNHSWHIENISVDARISVIPEKIVCFGPSNSKMNLTFPLYLFLPSLFFCLNRKLYQWKHNFGTKK
jgi:hypothetical protein